MGDIIPICCENHVMSAAFCPAQENSKFLAVGLVSGKVSLYKVDSPNHTLVSEKSDHRDSCRSVCWSPDGNGLFTASTDLSFRLYDNITGNCIWRRPKAHSTPINTSLFPSSNMLLTGDDDGGVKLWDTRTKSGVNGFSDAGDYISALIMGSDGVTCVAASGDGTLYVYDTRTAKRVDYSETEDDEILSLALIKGGSKLVTGTQQGLLQVYSWGQWDVQDDQFPGHPQSVDAMLTIDDDTVATGSADGMIRAVQLHPNKLLGVLGFHDEFPVEVLDKSSDNSLLLSTSHDDAVRLWDVAYLYEEDDDGAPAASAPVAGPGRGASFFDDL